MAITLNRQKAQEIDDADHRRHQEAVARAKSIDNAVHAFDGPKPVEQSIIRSSNGRGQLLAGAYPELPRREEVTRKKLDRRSISPEAISRTKGITLSDNALELYDLVLRAEQAAKHRGVVDLAPHAVATALGGITPDEARVARAELIGRNLIVERSDGFDKGYVSRS